VHIKSVVDTIQGANHPDNARIFGLSMTYDGHLIITFSDGVAVIDRELNTSSASFYRFADDEYGSNSIAVDENNGIYVTSNSIMHKLVWTGTTLSDKGVVGAWSCPYTHSTQPPIIKVGKGRGSIPTLMGPAYPTCHGAERFQWNTSTHKWPSV